ncbi:pyrokinin-1 receptor-like [Chelonus insularis]|uniref:pyrokinin-1 receptor-like n=1 Tax=Chelonus insularis TaxID=460826 RepID=UPI00158D8B6C|nr:pyrokinin-1 receptor-like [Chelonus insularis]
MTKTTNMIDNNKINIWNKNVNIEDSLIDYPRAVNNIRSSNLNKSEWLSDFNNNNNNNYSSVLAELLTAGVETNFNITLARRDALYIVIPITIIYAIIFLTGLIGNVSTCVVIARNRSMHTATNYYLFSLALSDLLLLVSGLPPEMYYIWSHFPYIFGEAFCIIQSFAAETSANATILTITAFTIERYLAICHPFLSHTMSKLSRAVKYIVAIWLLALCLAIPQAIQFGVVYSHEMNGSMIPDTAMCSIKWVIIEHAFEISTILLFVGPMTIITVLYILIGIKLRHSRLLTNVKRNPLPGCLNHGDSGKSRGVAQRNVIRMLVAVVVAFFICWAPFHAQRLLAVYAQNTANEPRAALVTIYTVLTYISGIFYYLSTTVNPLLYNIMSNKFREAFKSMLAQHCSTKRSSQKDNPLRQTYSGLSRNAKSTNKQPDPQSSSSASDDIRQLASFTHCQHHDDHQQSMTTTNSNTPKYLDNVMNWRSKPDNPRLISLSKTREITLVTSLPECYNDSCNSSRRFSQAFHRCFNKNDQSSIEPTTIGILTDCSQKFFTQHRSPSLTKFPFGNKLAHSHSNVIRHNSIDSNHTIHSTNPQDLNKTEFVGLKSSIL